MSFWSSFGHILKAIFVSPFVDFFKSDVGKQYEQSAKALLSTAEGQLVLAVVDNLNSVDVLTSSAKRAAALATIAAVAVKVGFTLATSEAGLILETAVSYLKGKFGDQTVTVAPEIKQAADEEVPAQVAAVQTSSSVVA